MIAFMEPRVDINNSNGENMSSSGGNYIVYGSRLYSYHS